MKTTNHRQLLVAAFFLFALPHAAAADPAPRHLSVLAVGNSYAGNARLFPEWVKGSGKGHTVHFQRLVMGGSSLDHHRQAVVELSGKAPAAHKKTAMLEMPLGTALNGRNWDYVTLQQVFPISADARTYEPSLGNLIAYIKTYAPEAQVVFYQTWTYRQDDAYYAKKPTPTRAQMIQSIIDATALYAKKYGMPIIPAGEGMRNAERARPLRTDPDFNYKNPPSDGNGPKEKNSLYKGWITTKDGRKKLDTVHAGIVGEYIIGGIWYAVLFDESPIGNQYRPAGMSEADALFCQKIVDDVTKGRRLPAPAAKTAPKNKVDFSKDEAALKRLKTSLNT